MIEKIPVLARLPLVLFCIYWFIVTLNLYSFILFVAVTSYIIYDDNRKKTSSEAGIDQILLNGLTSYYGTDWLNDVNTKGLHRKQWAAVLNKYAQTRALY